MEERRTFWPHEVILEKKRLIGLIIKRSKTYVYHKIPQIKWKTNSVIQDEQVIRRGLYLLKKK